MIAYQFLNTRLNDVLLKKDWRPDFDFTKYFIKCCIYEDMQAIFDQSFLDKLNQFSPLKNMMIFCKDPGRGPGIQSQLHTDPRENMGLNFIKPIGQLYQSDGILRRRNADAGIMHWYTKKPKFDEVTIQTQFTMASTAVNFYENKDVEFLTQAKTDDRLILVSTELPHCITPAPNTHRICFSFRFHDKTLTTENSIDKLIQLGL